MGKDRRRSGKARHGGTGQDPMHRHVLRLAREHASGEGETAPRLDDPRFDDALDAMAEQIMAIVGGDGLPDFLGGLEREALDAAPLLGFDHARGRSAYGFTKLFFVPVHGDLAAIRALVADDASFHSLVTSFRARGLVIPETNLILSRVPLEGRHLVEMGPAAIAGIVARCAKVVSSRVPAEIEGVIESAVAAALPGMRVGGEMYQDGIPVLGSRVLVGLRQSFVRFDPGREDTPSGARDYVEGFVDPRLLDADDDLDGTTAPLLAFGVEDPWLRTVNALREGVAFEPPCDLGTAVAGVARNALESTVIALRVQAGLDPRARADRIHVLFEDDMVRVLVEHDGEVLGPAEVPMLLAARDMDAFTDAMVALGGPGSEMLHYQDGHDMPAPHRTIPAVRT